MNKRLVCDTSVIVDGRIIELIKKEKGISEIIIPEAAIAELEHQANIGKETGFTGLDILKKLRKICEEKNILFSIEGNRPAPHHIEFAKSGEIDALIRKMAKELDGILITGDKVQYAVAKVEGIETIYLRAREEVKELSFMKYFDRNTMSVHFKEGCKPIAKVGGPGRFILKEFPEKISIEKIRLLSEEIIEATKRNAAYYVEIDRKGSTVIQMGEYRIVINKPPFSDGFEITIVKPIKKLKLSDYNLGEKLKKRIEERAEGIIICGPPGSGKSTFAAALAEFYHSKNKVVKTMESPRDLRVVDEITQYSALEGDFDLTKEILLLVRPDYTFYDEMRKTKDFEIYADMRMAGVGCVGVVHGKRAIDAVQRFINKIELGMIPQVVDTIILIDKGEIGKVYELRHTVKVPAGMRDADLARPVVEVRDFNTGRVEYEIYKFGEETVVLPIEKKERAIEEIEKALRRIIKGNYEVKRRGKGYVIKIEEWEIPRVIKKLQKKLKRLERQLGKIEVQSL